MASLRTWRTVAAALVLVMVATTGTAVTAEGATPGHQQALYCKKVDAYRLKTCAKAILPATPVGRELRWVLAQLAGEADTLTEVEVRAHFSAEYFAVWGDQRSPAVLVEALRQTIAELGGPRSWLALPIHPGPARRWRWSRARPGYGERCGSASPTTAWP